MQGPLAHQWPSSPTSSRHTEYRKSIFGYPRCYWRRPGDRNRNMDATLPRLIAAWRHEGRVWRSRRGLSSLRASGSGANAAATAEEMAGPIGIVACAGPILMPCHCQLGSQNRRKIESDCLLGGKNSPNSSLGASYGFFFDFVGGYTSRYLASRSSVCRVQHRSAAYDEWCHVWLKMGRPKTIENMSEVLSMTARPCIRMLSHVLRETGGEILIQAEI